MRIGNRDYATKNHTYIMGILNVTPDSFSDGGKYHYMDASLYRVEEMIKEGADILDIGGESTRPGYIQISVEEEIGRIAPVIEAIKRQFDIPISLDTYKSEVARAGIAAGADMINDIWGLQYDGKMAEVIAQNKVACCLMHNRKNSVYRNFIQEVMEDLQMMIGTAKGAGVEEHRIILDPGVGFAKSYEQNLEIMSNLSKLHETGYPLLLGTSRKSVIGLTLDLPVEERLYGTLATSAYGVMQGCMFLRVHDIRANKEVVKMLEAIIM